jgi:beta-lactamase superfamily II metal-dependent hydrolase
VQTRTSRAAPATTTLARIAFVSVGQGDAILIKSGPADVLVDGGPEGASAAVDTAMRELGMRELDVVVATHMHADHIGAADDLTLTHGPERVLVAGRVHASMKQAARAAGADLVQARRGDTYRWGAVKAEVMSPGGVSGDANADSIVLLLEVGGRRILLTGDLTGPNEEVVAGICARGPPLYALKVSHHGSRSATASGFLGRTDPRFAVISVGANSYGHPTPETVSRLTSSGARVYTTQKNGTITLTVRSSGSVRWEFSRSSGPMTEVAQRGTTSGGSTTRVFVTATGERYHSDGCRHLTKSRVPVTLKEARARGYTACSVCRPRR